MDCLFFSESTDMNALIRIMALLTTAGTVGILSSPKLESQTAKPAVVAFEKQLDILKDPRLSQKINLDIDSIDLTRTLQGISQATGINLISDKSISNKRVVVKCKNEKLSSMLQAISEAMSCVWIRNDKNPKEPEYTLFKTEQRKRFEKQAIELSENRASLVQEEVIKAELAGLADPVQSEHAQIIADLFNNFKEDEKKQCLIAGTEFFGTHDASPRNTEFNFFGARSFDKMSAAMQTTIVKSLSPSVLELETNAGTSGLNGAPALKGSYIGLMNLGASFALATVRKGESAITSSSMFVFRKGLPGIDSDDDSNLEMIELMKRGNLITLGALSVKDRTQLIDSKAFIDRHSFASLLDTLFKKTSLPIVSDSGYATEASYFFNLLTDKPKYTLTEALEYIAKAHAHEFRFSSGILIAKTVAIGLDAGAEIDVELTNRLSKVALYKKGHISLLDATDIAALSDLQMEYLPYNISVPVPTTQILSVKQYRPLLRMYGSLTRTQITQAYSDRGVKMVDLTAVQKQFFDRLAYSGLPGKLDFKPLRRTLGLFLQKQRTGETKFNIILTLITGGEEEDIRTFQLPISELNGVLTYSP